jgi:hypothetical protein
VFADEPQEKGFLARLFSCGFFVGSMTIFSFVRGKEGA